MVEHKRIRRKKHHHDDEQVVHSRKSPNQTTNNTALQMTRDMQVTPQNALQLQRTLGNAAVQRMAIQREADYPQDPSKTPLSAENIIEYINFHPTRQAMMNFAESELASENFDCLENIMLFEKNPTPMKAREIYNLFIGEEVITQKTEYNPNTKKDQTRNEITMTAPYAVNISGGYRKAVQQAMERIDIECPNNLFEKVKKDVLLNIFDTFSRLKYTKEWKAAYAKFVKSKEPSLGSKIKSFFGGLFGSKKKP